MQIISLLGRTRANTNLFTTVASLTAEIMAETRGGGGGRLFRLTLLLLGALCASALHAAPPEPPVAGLSLTPPVPSGATLMPGQDYAQFILRNPNITDPKKDFLANRHHTGLDIPAPIGTKVVAAAGGAITVYKLVERNNRTNCLGNVVVINHGSASTLYAHLSEITFVPQPGKAPSRVEQHQEIGKVGESDGFFARTDINVACNAVTGPHLHFELKNEPVLGATCNGANTFGYTPAGAGQRIHAHHPDDVCWNFHDPILNLVSGITPAARDEVVVTSHGQGTASRVGPGTNFRSIFFPLSTGERYLRTHQRSATTGCSKGWFQLVKINNGSGNSDSYFRDRNNGDELPDLWACSGNGSEVWIAPTTTPSDVVSITTGPSGTPNPVASQGIVTLSVTATDSQGHTLSYAWTASCPTLGSAGTFNNASLRTPTWTAPSNTTGSQKSCTLSVTARDSFGKNAQRSFTQNVSTAGSHTVTITAGPSGNPNPVASGRTTNLSVTATDSLGHALSYAWTASCPNLSSAGGFNSATSRTPTWTAPSNTTGSQKSCTLSVTARDSFGKNAQRSFISRQGSFTQNVSAAAPDTVTIISGPSGSPNPVASGGTSNLTVSGRDSRGHLLRYSWTGSCSNLSGGSNFSSTSNRTPVWTAPINSSGTEQSCTLRVTLSDGFGNSRQGSFIQRVSSAALTDTVTITGGPSGSPNPTESQGTVDLTVSATDSQSHPLSYLWSSSCPNLSSQGIFSNPTVRTPSWSAPVNSRASTEFCTFDVTASGGRGNSDQASFSQGVQSERTSPLTTLHLFISSDGAFPVGELVQAADGKLYGVTGSGGAFGRGTIFRMAQDGSAFQTLVNFDNTNGRGPSSGLMRATDGFYYGTTQGGGAFNEGTVYRVGADGTGFRTIVTFDLNNGESPNGKLIQGTDGLLYGTTRGGGSFDKGTIFRVATDGTGFRTLVHFDETLGANPTAGVIQGRDGSLYGTTDFGGTKNSGTLFRLRTDGSNFSTLVHFDNQTGNYPYGTLVQDDNGVLFGITHFLGPGSLIQGTVFRVNPDGSGFGTLVAFNFSGENGSRPEYGLIIGSDGNLYGTTTIGGASDLGTVFQVGRDGSNFRTLISFDGPNGNQPAGLLGTSDGTLFGITSQGGTGNGTVFRLR